jgi:chaperonin cofactor prefoldin
MMTTEELEELTEDAEYLCREIGKFLNKWKGKLFKPLEKALEMLETWLSCNIEG